VNGTTSTPSIPSGRRGLVSSTRPPANSKLANLIKDATVLTPCRRGWGILERRRRIGDPQSRSESEQAFDPPRRGTFVGQKNRFSVAKGRGGECEFRDAGNWRWERRSSTLQQLGSVFFNVQQFLRGRAVGRSHGDRTGLQGPRRPSGSVAPSGAVTSACSSSGRTFMRSRGERAIGFRRTCVPGGRSEVVP